MPKINLDEDKALSEPIEIIIEGETFTVEKITNKQFRKVAELTDVAEQFALLTGAKLSVVNNLNLMKLARAIQHIIQVLMGSMGMRQDQLFINKVTEEDKQVKAKND